MYYKPSEGLHLNVHSETYSHRYSPFNEMQEGNFLTAKLIVFFSKIFSSNFQWGIMSRFLYLPTCYFSDKWKIAVLPFSSKVPPKTKLIRNSAKKYCFRPHTPSTYEILRCMNEFGQICAPARNDKISISQTFVHVRMNKTSPRNLSHILKRTPSLSRRFLLGNA